ncbi:MAG: hypothetical protein CM15mP120_27000 [Pseudomonadota bacterium]|nr:MAG: hypothetical protein CM15mP120_27000 [Pseudomonadota bacterium]
MSDGGTFSYVAGLQDQVPFTHLAPCSASFHPMLIEAASPERLQGLPIYLIHGALDWMFPVDVARAAQQALQAAGAAVVYAEVEDLSHTYPEEYSAKVLDWLKPLSGEPMSVTIVGYTPRYADVFAQLNYQ